MPSGKGSGDASRYQRHSVDDGRARAALDYSAGFHIRGPLVGERRLILGNRHQGAQGPVGNRRSGKLVGSRGAITWADVLPIRRILIAQAIVEGFGLVTSDRQIAVYPVPVVW